MHSVSSEDRTQQRRPRVSIGLPVYNGAAYLEQALDSLLKQTFSDFELIISDNASTDRTPEICAAYASRDPRIRYFRSDVNRGAAWNFNRVFEEAAGDYFKWMAHDDVIFPDFLEKCVQVLDSDPSAVLCYSKVTIIDGEGDFVRQYDVKLRTDSDRAWLRFRDLLMEYHLCFDVFGLIRSDALRQTPVMGNYAHGDGILLSRLALLGRFHEIPEFLFLSRKHGQQSMNVYGVYRPGENDYHQYAVWFDPAKNGRLIFPTWRMLREHVATVAAGPVGFRDKALSWLYIPRWMVRRRRPLLIDLRVAGRWATRRLASAITGADFDSKPVANT